MTAPPVRPAVLLMGPPGAGKSPLGDALERRTGWLHFDFGAQLRRIASGAEDDVDLAPPEREFIRGLIENDALFPEERFDVARSIAAGFVHDAAAAQGFTLNGLPRRADQAQNLAGLLDVGLVIVLDCPPDVAASRVSRRRAGETPDHAGREDDAPDRLARRRALYEQHKNELCAYYLSAGAAVLTLPVGEDSIVESLAATALATTRLRVGP